MLVASVLAVVAGSPAQAANTASEVKVDHDGNAATAMAREFAGQDRYDTAFRLAKNFAAEKGGLGAVPAAFVLRATRWSTPIRRGVAPRQCPRC